MGDMQATPQEAVTRVDILQQPPAIHPVAAQSFDALHDAGVRWCLLRGERRLASPPHDVDILVSQADLLRATEALGSVGFAAVPTWARGSHRFFVEYEADAGGWLQIDAVTELAYGPQYAIQTDASAGCLTRRERIGPLTVLSGDDAFWTLLLHCLLDKETIEIKHRAPLQALSPSADAHGVLARYVNEVTGNHGCAAKLLAFARSSDWAKLEAAGRSLAAAWSRRDRARVAFVRMRAHLGRRVARLVYPVLRQGFSVALLGPDGAGKTTLATGLETAFPLPAKRVYMGPFQRPARMGVPQRVAIAWSRYLVGFAFRLLGRLVVFERYTLDALLLRRRQLTGVDRARRWLLGHACPAPDLIVLLDAPPGLLKDRRGEESLDALEDQRRRYLAIARALERSAVVDATRDTETLRREVVAVIWHAYCRNQRRATTF